MRVIIVGAGGLTRELLRRLGELWDVTVIDVDEAAFERARGIREFERVVGDGSSPVVLRRAGLERSDALVAVSHDDDVNLEAVKIAQEAGLLRVIGVVAEPERAADYRAIPDVTVIVPDSMAARSVEVHLEPRRIASTAFADGKAEAIEFYVSPDSPVRGKRLRDLHSDTWIVAAVLRQGKLIVPHGNTVIEAGDRVTVVGAAADFATIVRTFTAGESRFPLSFGRKVAVAMESAEDLDGPVSEAISLVRNTQAEELLVVHPDPDAHEELGELVEKLEAKAEGVALDLRSVSGSVLDGLLGVCREESVGVIVAPAPSGGEVLGRLRAAKAINTYGKPGLPVLFARGKHPYSHIVVPARRTLAGEVAGRAAIDIARSTGAALTGVAVVPPVFISGEDTIDAARRAASWLREEAAVQGVAVRRRVRRGNPVRVLEEIAAGASLLVLSMPELPVSALRPGITGHLVRSVPASVLLVPVRL